MNSILWVVLLMMVGLSVMALEVFVPSGGILGFISVTAIVAAIATAFLELGAVAGMTVLAMTVVSVPCVLGLAFRWFPQTPLGHRVLPPPPDAADLLPDANRRHHARTLVGRSGETLSELLPWGSIEIDGMTLEALSESGPIEVGTRVEAVGVQGTALVVRILRSDDRADGESFQPENKALELDSRLSQTLEAFEFEALNPPTA